MRFQEARDRAKELGVRYRLVGFSPWLCPSDNLNITSEFMASDRWEVEEPKKKMRIFMDDASNSLHLFEDDGNTDGFDDVTELIRELLKEE